MRSPSESGNLAASDSESAAIEAELSPNLRPSGGPRPADTQVRDAGLTSLYANFCRVTGTPEELILDFGLNPQPLGITQVIDIQQRLVLNYFTAKRLLQALAMSVQRHEVAFGTLETDANKRVATTQRTPADRS